MSKGPSMGAASQRAIPTNVMSAQAFVAALIGNHTCNELQLVLTCLLFQVIWRVAAMQFETQH
jgi:hypothetical protein